MLIAQRENDVASRGSLLCSQSSVESVGAIWRDIFGAALTLTARLMQHHRHTKKRKPNPDLITAGARKRGRRKRDECKTVETGFEIIFKKSEYSSLKDALKA